MRETIFISMLSIFLLSSYHWAEKQCSHKVLPYRYINRSNQQEVIQEIKLLEGVLSIEKKYYDRVGILFLITTKDDKSKIVFTADKQKLTEVLKIINQLVDAKQVTNKNIKISDQTGEVTFLFQVRDNKRVHLIAKANIQTIELALDRQNLSEFQQMVHYFLPTGND